MRAPDLSVVIPVYNEGSNVREVIREVADVFADTLTNYEIILVDDGSDDVIEPSSFEPFANIPQLTLITHSRKSGKSAALRTGFKAARAIWVATMDGDGQDDPRFIVEMASCVDLNCINDDVTQ